MYRLMQSPSEGDFSSMPGSAHLESAVDSHAASSYIAQRPGAQSKF